MVLRYLIVFILIIFVCPLSYATIINIPADWPTIQQGIDASADGDTVLVQPGTYVENINFNGHNIVLGSLFLTTGDTSFISTTIIDGDSAGTVVTFENGENSAAIITGFSIRNGYQRYYGGGLICDNGSSPTIKTNRIFDNQVWYRPYNEYGNGGGIACISNSEAIITDNVIFNNEALFEGAGIFCGNSNPIISLNIIKENIVESGPGGGGIACDSSNAVISNNIIIGNSDGSAGTGGAIYMHGSGPIIINNTIEENETGGIACWFYSIPVLTNNILRNNNLYEVSYNLSVPTINYCNIQGGWLDIGNIDLDPLLRDPENGDFHLMSIACGDSADSPCIDAGDPNILDSLLDCSWGLGGVRSDMGAFGGGDSLVTGILNSLPPLPNKMVLIQNFPNPFNAQTAIRFILPESEDVQLTIYDLLGRQVEKIVDGYMPAGVYTFNFDASGISSGVYFYRLEAGDRVETKRMLLLK